MMLFWDGQLRRDETRRDNWTGTTNERAMPASREGRTKQRRWPVGNLSAADREARPPKRRGVARVVIAWLLSREEHAGFACLGQFRIGRGRGRGVGSTGIDHCCLANRPSP